MPGVWRSAVLLLVLCFLGWGCSQTAEPDLRPLTVTIGAALPAQGPAGNGFAGLVSYFVTEPLLSVASDGRPTARLATAWTWLNGHKTFRLKIRPGVVFHDGTPLTAEIAAESLRREVRRGDLSYQSVVSIRAVGPHVLEIDLSRPEAFLPEDLATLSITTPGTRIGTGPYERVSEEPFVTLKAFDRYYRGKPTVRELSIKRYSTQRSAWAAMMRGDIDSLHEVSREAAEFVAEESSVRSYKFIRPYYIALVFNVRHPILGRAGVRRALNQAIEKREVVSSGLRGHGESANGPIWPRHWALTRTTTVEQYDPAKAKAELDALGLTSQDRGGEKTANRFSFTCLVWAEDSRYEQIALILQKQLFDIGVDMKLEPVTMQDFAQRAMAGNFDAFLIEMLSNRSLSFVYRFWHSPVGPPLLNSGYSAADGVLDRLRHSVSDEDTRRATAELQHILHEDPPAVFLAWQETTRAVSARFDPPVEDSPDVMATIWRWHLRQPTETAAQDP